MVLDHARDGSGDQRANQVLDLPLICLGLERSGQDPAFIRIAYEDEFVSISLERESVQGLLSGRAGSAWPRSSWPVCEACCGNSTT